MIEPIKMNAPEARAILDAPKFGDTSAIQARDHLKMLELVIAYDKATKRELHDADGKKLKVPKDHHALRCDECNGEGALECGNCEGSAVGDDDKDCDKCLENPGFQKCACDNGWKIILYEQMTTKELQESIAAFDDEDEDEE